MFKKFQKKWCEKKRNNRLLKRSFFESRGSHSAPSSDVLPQDISVPTIINTNEASVFVESPPPDVRLVLFKELGDTSERVNIFDSRSCRKVECQPQKNCSALPETRSAGSAPGSSVQYQQCGRSSSDSEILSEMLFGSVGMAQKAPSLKIHEIRNPSQIMLSRVFCLPSSKDSNTTSLDRVMENQPEILRNNPVLSRRKARTMPVPATPNKSIQPQKVVSSYTDNLHRSDSSNSLSAFFANSYQGISQSLTGSLGSNSSRSTSLSCERAHSLPKYQRDSFALLDENDEAVPLRRTRMRLGFAVLFQAEPSNATSFHQFFFDHFPIIESHVTALKDDIEKCFKQRGKPEFIKALMQATHSFTSKLHALYSSPRLPEPVWSTLTSPGSAQEQRDIVIKCFVPDLARLVVQYNTKQTNYFLSGLLTAVLTHHLGWVGFSSSGQKQTTQDDTCNALWAQLGDLYGAVGSPTKVSRTVVSGSQHETVSTVLSVLSYFIQCALIEDTVAVPGKITPDVVMAPTSKLEMSLVDCDIEEDEYVLVSLDNVSQDKKNSGKHLHGVEAKRKANVLRSKSSPHAQNFDDSAPSVLCRSHSGPMVKKNRERSNAILDKFMRQRTYSNDAVSGRTIRSRRKSSDSWLSARVCSKPKQQVMRNKPQTCSKASILATDGAFCLKHVTPSIRNWDSIVWPEIPTHNPNSDPVEGNSVKRVQSTSTLNESNLYKADNVRRVQTFTDLLEPPRTCVVNVQRADVTVRVPLTPPPVPRRDLTSKPGHKKTSSVGAIKPTCFESDSDGNTSVSKGPSPPTRSVSNPSSESRRNVVSTVKRHSSNTEVKCRIVNRRHPLPTSPPPDATPSLSNEAKTITDNKDNASESHSPSFHRLKLMRIPSVEINHQAFDEYFDSSDSGNIFDDHRDVTTPEVDPSPTKVQTSLHSITAHVTLSPVHEGVAKPPPLPRTGPNRSLKPTQPPLPAKGPVGAVTFKVGTDRVAFHQSQVSCHKVPPSSHIEEVTRTVTNNELSPVKEEMKKFEQFTELSLPLLKPVQDNICNRSDKRDFTTLIADYSPEFLNDFTLHGIRNKPNIHNKIMHDLRHRARNQVLDEPVSEALCIHADIDTCSVKVYSSHRLHSDNTSLPALTSRLVNNILQQVAQLSQMKVSPRFCLEYLEGEMRQLVLKSRMLAEYVKGHKRVTVSQLSAVLGIESQDLPLLMSIASCHSPHVAKIMI